MRYLLILLIICILSSCNKDDNVISQTPNNITYEIKNIKFSISSEPIDSVFTKLDTIYYSNTSYEQQPDTTIYPYRNLKDSLKIIMDTSKFDNLVFKDSMGFRPMELDENKEIRKFSKDSIYVSQIPDNFTFSVRNAMESVSFRPKARTKHAITGEYWRIKYDIKFEAEIINNNNDLVVISGIMRYSLVRTNSYYSKEQPKTIIIITSNI